MIGQVVETLGGELALGADKAAAHPGDSFLNVRVEVRGHRGGGGAAGAGVRLEVVTGGRDCAAPKVDGGISLG